MSREDGRADRDRLRAYYASGAEASRLQSEDGWFELERTLELVNEHVAAHSRILDVGGGTGVHARALAQLGHRVTLVDLSPELIEIARATSEPALEQILCEDIATYQPDSQFDAVLCLGPGYHSGSEEEFAQMCQHATRFVREGGWVFMSFIPRLTGVAGLVARAASHPEQVTTGMLSEVMRTGVFRNASSQGFGEVYFAWPEEVQRAFENAGVTMTTICSIRGFAAYYGAALERLRDEQPGRYEEVRELTRQTASAPEVVATCWHAMYIGRRAHA